MKIKAIVLTFLFGAFSIIESLNVQAQNQPVQLPKPQTEGGRPLMEVLKDRQSSRSFSNKELSDQMLSNLLWAAFGVNRPSSGNRTAPSAHNKQEVDIYVALAKGTFLYNAGENALIPVSAEDIRGKTGTQGFVNNAAVNLIFVADFKKMGGSDDTGKYIYSSVSAGSISENVYLFCASEGLATVVRGSMNKAELSKILKLNPDQKIIVAQTVGYPKE